MDSDRRFNLRYGGINGVALGALGVGRRFTEVVVDQDSLRVTVGPGGWAFRALVPRDRIRAVTPAERPFVGWGVHGWRGRWLVNGSLRGIVAIEIDPEVRARVLFVPVRLRILYLSLADPDGFVSALEPGREWRPHA